MKTAARACLRRLRFSACFLCLPVILATVLPALTIPSDGSDGSFSPTANVVVDLSQAPTGSWDTPGTGTGIYDPLQWAVVFKFSEVSIPSGVTVTFLNHPSRAPVIWLVEGDVVVNGAIVLDGAGGHAGNALRTFAEPAPGGFRGGRGSDAQTSGAAGMGPGGAGYGPNTNHAGSGAGYATVGGLASTAWSGGTPGEAGAAYGNAGVFPLIGGSGGAGSANGATGKGGGAGGGAILIATTGAITLNGQIRANGGPGTNAGGGDRASGGGSGGGIRLICESISGTGTLRALGGAGGSVNVGSSGGNGSVGRIRVEAFSNSLVDLGNPAFSLGVPEEAPRLFRDATTPEIRAVSLNGEAVPADPLGRLAFPETDVSLPEAGMATLVLEAENVPLDSEVVVRLVRRTGINETYTATLFDGTFESSTWTAEINVGNGFSTIQVRANFPGNGD